MDSPPLRDLAELRARIDAIDADIHALLMERSKTIDALIAIKRAGEPGAAFRPSREAAMMQKLVDRHKGLLPLVTVEHVFREVISTFTFLQAPYTVHVATGDDAETRDMARFYFGFTVPFETVAAPHEAIAAVGRSSSDLAVVRLGEAAMPWWLELGLETKKPRIIGRLPFLVLRDRPVATPAVIVSMELQDRALPERWVFSCRGPWLSSPFAAFLPFGIEVIAWSPENGKNHKKSGQYVIAFATGEQDPRVAMTAILHRVEKETGTSFIQPRLIGGYAAPLRIDSL